MFAAVYVPAVTVVLDKDIDKNDFEQILAGVELEDVKIAADALDFVKEDYNQSKLYWNKILEIDPGNETATKALGGIK